ncbi:L-2,3-diaminopropanoate--citrate ligase SbnE [Actinomycetospora sp. NBRC 106375]|uniref:IucA/IucC family protein n=1 Tax=Actinomycetospora sp. NBRC 106375 TaxID=3032207 RepID=UPI0024A03F77|nr:IucA/IucC family protein [Actinomycetospora sp. NBRC 106375]GLZ47688.1 L-2,3-diaminopropanoate--citrate ligase SbnE [Actinomycetospora sp. NBRC 106375]
MSSTGPRARAECAARERLVVSLLRETDPPVTRDGDLLRITLPAGVLGVRARVISPTGHHRFGPDMTLDDRAADHDAVVAAVLDAVAAPPGHAALVADSVRRTARYLAAPPRREPDPTRAAEQALRLGHPFHPTPKSAEGLGDDDLATWAPELGASFVLHHLALDPRVVVSGGAPAPPTPAVAAHLPDGWTALPVHPFQARVLAGDPTLALLEAEGSARWLGPLGDPVWPTSSVRTVVDTVTGAAWKLPLRARLTHFVRTTPVEQARRAVDAGIVVDGLGALPAGFGVIADRGFATLDPAVGGERLAADLTVMTRAPFPPGGPRVLAALLEDGPGGEEPPLMADVRAAGNVHAWLRRWLAVSLLPLLRLFGAAGIGFEAHPQNTLVVTDASGWPTACWVRDLEGAHVRRDRMPPGLADDSPLVYPPAEAWQRLRYHAVVNHLALLVAVLGRCTVGEDALWDTVAATLAAVDDPDAAPWAADLLTSPTLPAKAHLRSWAVGRGEDPIYLDLPNPIAAARRAVRGGS